MDPNIAKLLQDTNFDDPGDEDDGDIDEAGLEDELGDILGGKTKSPVKSAKKKPPPKKGAKPSPAAPPPNAEGGEEHEMAAFDMDNIQNLLKTFDEPEDDEDEDIDENDPALLAELSNVIENPLPTPKKRGAKPAANGSLPVAPKPVAPPVIEQITVQSEEPEPAKPSENDQKIEKIKNLQVEYKRAALKAKTAGDKNAALTYLRIAKQLDGMLNSLNSGEDVDMTKLPPAPQDLKMDAPQQAAAPEELDPAFQMNQEEASKIFNAPTSAGTILEALEQRLAKFTETKKKAEDEQNANKARRLGRIVTQMQKAIKDYKAGKPVDFEELPCPPGFPPIPVEKKAQPASAPQKQPSAAQKAARPPMKRQMSTTASKQLNYLLERQKLFREAAMEAKKRGEIEQAKEYLRSAKGFDTLIEATRSGLPIDATSIPTPPQLNEDFQVVSKPLDGDDESGAGSVAEGMFDVDRDEIFANLAQELKQQYEMCNRNREYFLKMGDIPTSSRFEKYASESKKDLYMLLARKKNGDPIPSYRTEMRTFSIVVANLDVPLNELHVEVIRAFDFSGTPEIDTYVRADFAFPSEAPQWKRTKTFHDSLTPEYNDTLIFQIDRKSRSLPRILKRHPLKLTIYAKGGFLRSDQPIGTVLVKMDELETKCTIHESSAWTRGRKVIDGRLEVKVKIREPLLAKQIEEIKEKWIVFS